MTENKKVIGIVVECLTCGWRSNVYNCSEEGGEDCAKASAVIESRLGHIKDTAKVVENKVLTHEINFIRILQD